MGVRTTQEVKTSHRDDAGDKMSTTGHGIPQILAQMPGPGEAAASERRGGRGRGASVLPGLAEQDEVRQPAVQEAGTFSEE